MARRNTLKIWMNGRSVGRWSQPTRGDDALQYDREWVASEQGRPLSLSLPFLPGNAPHRGKTVRSYFDNLLPDSDAIRERIRSRHLTESTAAFDLLTAIGRDCVGAVQLLPDGEHPADHRRTDARPLDGSQVEQILLDAAGGLGTARGRSRSDFRISIAGAQEKTALLLEEGRWCEPLGSTPTTHILKLPLGLVGEMRADLLESVENEWLCSRILALFGLPVARSEIQRFGRQKVLVVERFDRSRRPGWIARLPQEDFCQALGYPSSLKYESDGGPGMKDILRVLTASTDSETDRRTFFLAQVLFWMLAATDGHAKNFSLFLERNSTFRLTPLYDVLSAWPIIGKGRNQLALQKAKLSMCVRSKNAHWKLAEIKPRHWDAVAALAGLGTADRYLEDIVKRTPRVIQQAIAELPKGFPARVSERITEGLAAQAGRLARG